MTFKFQMTAGVAITTVLLFEIYALIQCSVPLLKLPLALLLMGIPMGIVYLCFFNNPSPLPVVVGVAAMFPLYFAAYRIDCVDVSGAGGAGFGAVLPWLYGIPLGLCSAWLTKRFQNDR
jgi:hypothetical protein